MAILARTDYRLPGVYSREVAGPKLNSTIGGNAVVAFVGPAIGYRKATKISVFQGGSGVALGSTGVIADTVSVTNRVLGTVYENGRDFTVVTSPSTGESTVERVLSSCAATAQAIKGKTVSATYWAAEPTIDLMALAGAEGYVVKGTLTVSAKVSGGTDAQLVEGVSYEVDYRTGTFVAKAGENAVQNGAQLKFEFKYTTAEPVELTGEAVYELVHRYVERNGLREPSYNADGDVTENGVSLRLFVAPSYTDGAGKSYAFGDKAQPGAATGYEENVDFVVDYDNGRISRTPSSRIPSFSEENGALMYAEFRYCAIQQGARVAVDYGYRDDAYGEAEWYPGYNDLLSTAGEPWDPVTGEIQSPLSLAAYIANQNGLGGFYAVPVLGTYSASTGTTTYPVTAWQAAFDALTRVDGIDLVVPLSSDTAVWAQAKTHMARMKENQDERCTFLGMDGTGDVVGLLPKETMIGMARTYAANDTLLVAPSAFKFRNPLTSTVDVLPGYYAAAALAGYESSIPQYLPLTNKVVGGIYGAAERFTKVEKTTMSGSGLTFIDEATGGMRVLHGRSTSTESVIDQEINITLAKYYIIKTMRRTFATGYIGQVINGSTLSAIGSAAQNTLISLQSNGFMTSFRGLSVYQDELNPTQVNISFEYRPAYSLNYIEISFAVDGTTGSTDSY